MAYPMELKEKALIYRRRGYSLNELRDMLKIPKTTLSDWLHDVPLSKSAVRRLDKVVRKGRTKAAESKKAATRRMIETYLAEAINDARELNLDQNKIRFVCALLYYCEGRKSLYDVASFTNSDASLVQTFLALLRAGFNIDESKFRVCVHLHEYHNTKSTLQFWSDITKIPLSQFIKPFRKEHTGKRIRNGYNGCAAITYMDVKIARELLTMAEAFFKHRGP